MRKPSFSIDGTMFGFEQYGDSSYFMQVRDRNKAIPIITREHKPRCPYCSSPLCLHKTDEESAVECYDSKGRYHLYELSKCQKTGFHFLTELIATYGRYQKLECILCGSLEVKVNEKYILRPGEYIDPSMNKKGKELLASVGFFTLLVTKCSHCKHERKFVIAGNEENKFKFVTDYSHYSVDKVLWIMRKIHYYEIKRLK